MKNSRFVFNVLDKDYHVLVGYKDITCRLIFDVKMDLTRKVRYVAGGNITYPPLPTTYANMVSRYCVCLNFLISAWNNLDILSGYTQNAYLNTLTKEKVFSTLVMIGNMTKESCCYYQSSLWVKFQCFRMVE